LLVPVVRLSVRTLFLAGLVAAAAASWVFAQSDQRRDANSGPVLYGAFCASCHGETGKGDGPVADLGPRPSDLTRLKATHGGVFPRAQVRGTLDGTRPVEGHRTAMPNWRDVLRKTEHADDRTIDARMNALIAHLESLQK
jgi:mono/diheme cytochrome c family protein